MEEKLEAFFFKGPSGPQLLFDLGKPPRNCLQVQRGIARIGGGGLNACQDGLGHLSAPNQMGNLLDCGGVKMLARMVWGTYAVKIEVQMGICLC